MNKGINNNIVPEKSENKTISLNETNTNGLIQPKENYTIGNEITNSKNKNGEKQFEKQK